MNQPLIQKTLYSRDLLSLIKILSNTSICLWEIILVWSTVCKFNNSVYIVLKMSKIREFPSK